MPAKADLPSDEMIPVYELSNVGRALADQLIGMGHSCDFVVRAPGRVNLIGEHIDYNGYAVLPMALAQAIHLAAGSNNEATLVLNSTEPDFESVTIPVSEAMRFGSDGPPLTVKWFHYFLCAYHGITDYVNSHKLSWSPPGLVVLVGGAQFGGLWPAAGLSSSSAFVVASAIAVMQASGVRIGRRELAGLCARCEQYIGMQGGGMDQATSLLGSRNNAIMIEFTKPLVTVHPVPLPLDIVFVIAHTGVHARKAATSMYNERVSECRLATSILIRDAPNASQIDRTRPACLADAQCAWQLSRPGDMLKPTCDRNQSVVSARLHSGVYKLSELIDMGMSEEMVQFCLTATTKSMTEFKLRERADHVYAEAERVLAFYDLCCKSQLGGDTIKDSRHLSELLGRLMNESQESCAELYECSCPELDQLVKICRASGAIGSRLTSAGWGGCTVSMVPKALSQTFIERVCQEYYEPRGLKHASEGLIFVSQPGNPAGLMMCK
uniref:Galactokinase-like protein n=1 Tax=Fasciola hepatica TaxID=6192 RepID=A0A088CK35_FASHE|nr:galactokinase-like protein [Fasciola hepatica]